MKHRILGALALASCAAAPPAAAGGLRCPPDAVQVGNACIDTYEASVWQIPTTSKSLIKKVQQGKATLASLTAGGATQLAPASTCTLPSDYGPSFPRTGDWTPVPGSSPPSPGVYAASIPGVPPSGCITWFQANQACALSGKRLLRNDEWQRAAAGTPDPGTDDGATDCNVSAAAAAVDTGSRAKCRSSWGVYDMVGNVSEWVAEWADLNDASCSDWTTAAGIPGDDESCFGGSSTVFPLPGGLLRGGAWISGSGAGVLAAYSNPRPSDANPMFGFRCAR